MVFRIIRIHHSILFNPGKPVPPELIDAFQVVDTGIPTVKKNKCRLKSPFCSSIQHISEMVVLGEMILCKVVDSVIYGIGVASIGPDQGDQANSPDNFVLVATPLRIDQVDLFGMNLIEDSIIHNKPSGAFLNNRFNLLPERLRREGLSSKEAVECVMSNDMTVVGETFGGLDAGYVALSSHKKVNVISI